MKDSIESLEKLINAFTYLPGVGRKTAERYAYSVISLSNDEVNFFAEFKASDRGTFEHYGCILFP